MSRGGGSARWARRLAAQRREAERQARERAKWEKEQEKADRMTVTPQFPAASCGRPLGTRRRRNLWSRVRSAKGDLHVGHTGAREIREHLETAATTTKETM